MNARQLATTRHLAIGVPLGIAVGCFVALDAAGQSFWTHFARNEARTGLVGEMGVAALDVATPLWIASLDDASRVITFNGQSGPVVDRERVYALGRSGGISRVFAFRRADGLCVWSAVVPNPMTDSWSTPAIDESGDSIVVGAGNRVLAFDRRSGAALWTATLSRNIVNASPLVTPTSPRRIFVTDADGFGLSGRLSCINADRFDAAMNPYSPGQILWSTIIGGTSGNTPACADGRIIVASIGEFGFSAGSILAFDARATTEPAPLWTFDNTSPLGFFGGVTVSGGFGYAASYAFSGGQTAANLVKLSLSDGAPIWSVPSNRTDATPIVLGDGRIALSGGLAGFGASPSIQLFQDNGANATMLWDSAIATWTDTNTNGLRDTGEYLSIGGWTHQPVVVKQGGATSMLVGSLPGGTGTANPCTHLRLIDLSKAPTALGFVISTFVGTGSTPAIVGPSVYSVGAAGLHAFGPRFDVNADGLIDVEDLHSWELGQVSTSVRDVDCDGDVDAADRATLIEEVRRDEQRDMAGGVGGTR